MSVPAVLCRAEQCACVFLLYRLLSLNTTEYLALLHLDTVAAAGAGQKRVGVTQPQETAPGQ